MDYLPFAYTLSHSVTKYSRWCLERHNTRAEVADYMKRFLFVLAITILLLPMHFSLHGQDGGFGGGDSIDVTGLIGDRGGRGGGFGGQGNGRGGIQMPDSKELFSDIQSALKK